MSAEMRLPWVMGALSLRHLRRQSLFHLGSFSLRQLSAAEIGNLEK
jgi:hypothetical protein